MRRSRMDPATFLDSVWAAFENLDAAEQDRVIEFLKSLQVVPPNGRR